MVQKKWKIAFSDAATVDLGDLAMGVLARLGDYQPIPKCPGGRIPRKVRDAQVAITNKVVFGVKEMQAFPQLRLICVAATGVNNIDLEAARRLGIAVTNVAGYSTQTVVEHTLMFLLALSHRLVEHNDAVRAGKWSRSPIFTLLTFPFEDLTKKKLGLLGYGTIGKKVGKLARALGMEVLVARLPGRRYPKKEKRLPLNQVLQKSDFVSLHTALTPHTKYLLNRKRLAQMKATAYLLNLARGPIVVEKDVAAALERGRLAGYAADVTEREPLPKKHPFLKKSLRGKILLTPHIAWASRESRQRLVDEIAKNIRAFQAGRRRNRVD